MSKILATVSAPGSVMLTGEHGVLYNKQAVIAAISKKINISLSVRKDQLIVIKAKTILIKINVDNIFVNPRYSLITSILYFYKTQIKSGFDLRITSQIPESKGLGSSTALLVSFVTAIKFFLYQNTTKEKFIQNHKEEIFLDSKKILESLKQESSCADIIASINGGIILYKKHEIVKSIFKEINLILIYSGYKTKTSKVIEYIKPLREKFYNIFCNLENAIDEIAKLSFEAIEKNNFDLLGELFSINQGILEAMQLSTPLINYLINRLKDYHFIKGAKISGAGLGDSIIALCSEKKNIGFLHRDFQNIAFAKIHIAKKGLEIA